MLMKNKRARDDARERRAGKHRITQLRNAGKGRCSQSDGSRHKDAQMHTAQKMYEGAKSAWKHEEKGAQEEVRKLKK